MSLTYAEAIDAINGVFKTAWDTTAYAARVKYENVSEKDVPGESKDPWARITIRHTFSSQATLTGDTGLKRFRRNGVVAVSIFVEAGKGLPGSPDLAKVVQDAFEASVSPAVLFTNVRINEIGPDGPWFMTNVLADFEYDEQK